MLHMHKNVVALLFAISCCVAWPSFAGKTTPVHAPQTAAGYKPVIVFESGSAKSDKAFTEAAHTGAENARNELGIAYKEYKITPGEDRETVLRKIAESGATLIVAVGFQNVMPVLKLAEMYPNVRFTVIDGIVPPLFANVQSVIFKDHEGAFLVGMIAAYTSRTGSVGFIGGMDVPLIRNFSFGYIQGAKYARPDVKVLTEMVGATRDAWSNPARGSILAEKQFLDGVDVVFAAAGGSGLGVLQAAHVHGKLAIGVDTNQNGLHPGTVLTSMIKRVDLAVYDTLKNGRNNNWQAGIKYLGIKDNMLDFTVDRHNMGLISKETIEKVEAAKELILRGIIDVQAYTPN